MRVSNGITYANAMQVQNDKVAEEAGGGRRAKGEQKMSENQDNITNEQKGKQKEKKGRERRHRRRRITDIRSYTLQAGGSIQQR